MCPRKLTVSPSPADPSGIARMCEKCVRACSYGRPTNNFNAMMYMKVFVASGQRFGVDKTHFREYFPNGRGDLPSLHVARYGRGPPAHTTNNLATRGLLHTQGRPGVPTLSIVACRPA